MSKKLLCWQKGSNELGNYIYCPKCGHKYSTGDVLFADKDFSKCPFCKEELSMENVEYDFLDCH